MVRHVIVWTLKDELKGYATHPEHVAVATNIVAPRVKIRSCLDYEI